MSKKRDFKDRFISRQSRTSQFIENEISIRIVEKTVYENVDEKIVDVNVIQENENEFEIDDQRDDVVKSQSNSNDARKQFKQSDENENDRSINKNFFNDSNDFYVSRRNIIFVSKKMSIASSNTINFFKNQSLIIEDTLYDKKSFDFDDKKKIMLKQSTESIKSRFNS